MSKLTLVALSLFAMCATCLTGMPSAATVWDATADFSLTTNGGTNPWSYGFCEDSELNGDFFTAYAQAGVFAGVLSEWSMDTDDSLSKGAIFKNPTSDMLQCSWPARFAGNELGYHSGVNNLARPTLRWTAPEAGWVSVIAAVSGADYANVTSTEGHIRYNDVVLWSGNVNGYGGTPPDYADKMGASPLITYSGFVEVAVGDTIDLVGGAQGAFPGDSTRWSFTIQTGSNPATVSGTVSYNVPGSPAVAGARVSIAPGPYPPTTTDGSGAYSFSVSPGQYTVTANVGGFPAGQAEVSATADTVATANIAIPAGKFTGTVTSSQAGNPPIQRVHVDLIGTDFSASTDASGSYSLIVPPGTYSLRFSRPGCDTAEVENVEIASGQVITQSPRLVLVKEMWDACFDFSPASNTVGEWTYGYTDWGDQLVPYDVADEPIADLHLWETSEGQESGFIGKYLGDKMLNNNNLMFEPLRGFYESGQLFCFPSESWDTRPTIRWTAPKSGWFIAHVELRGQTMALGGGSINGMLRLEDWTELYTCMVKGFAGTSAWNYGDRFGDNPVCEVYRYAYVNAGSYIDLVVDDSGNNNDFDLTGVVFTVETTTIEPGAVEGHVTAAVGGAFLEGIEVVTSDGRFRTTTDYDGSYNMHVPSGPSVTLTASGLGYSPQEKTISVPADAITTCDFQLNGARLSGHISKAGSAEPISGALVKTSDGAYSTHSEYDGSYELKVVGGTYDIVVFYPGYVTQTANVTVGSIASRDFTMSPETTIDADLAEDFLANENPNSYWAYGYYFAGFDPTMWTLYDTPATAVPGKVIGWGDPFNVNGGFIIKNFSNSTKVYYVPMPAGTLQWHPGWSDARPTAIWTAPKSAKVMVSASIQVCDPPMATTTAVVRHNGAETMSGSINGLGQPQWSSARVIDIVQGDTIEFCLTWGENSSIPSDSTRYDGHIAEVSLIEVSSISDLKAMADESYVRLAGKAAICDGSTFTDGFYVEELSRTCGIKIAPVVSADGVVTGDLVTVTGILSTDAAGSRYIAADSVESASGQSLKSVGINNRGFATLDCLLTRIWGNVTFVDTVGHSYLYVDDGGSLADGSGNLGIRVDISKLAAPDEVKTLMDALVIGQTVSVTGVAGRDLLGESVTPVIRPRSASDFNSDY